MVLSQYVSSCSYFDYTFVNSRDDVQETAIICRISNEIGHN